MDISHIIDELGEDRENYFNSVAPPIMQISNFAFPIFSGNRCCQFIYFCHGSEA